MAGELRRHECFGGPRDGELHAAAPEGYVFRVFSGQLGKFGFGWVWHELEFDKLRKK